MLENKRGDEEQNGRRSGTRKTKQEQKNDFMRILEPFPTSYWFSLRTAQGVVLGGVMGWHYIPPPPEKKTNLRTTEIGLHKRLHNFAQPRTNEIDHDLSDLSSVGGLVPHLSL